MTGVQTCALPISTTYAAGGVTATLTLTIEQRATLTAGAAVPIATLRRLCDVFGVSIGWMLGLSHSGPERERDVVVRSGDRARLEFPGLGISEELLSPSPNSPLEMLISTFEPGADSDDYSHDGDEAGLVIEGTLDLWVDGVHHVLKKGDSFAFPSTTPHRCANHGKKPVKVLWVITPPHY